MNAANGLAQPSASQIQKAALACQNVCAAHQRPKLRGTGVVQPCTRPSHSRATRACAGEEKVRRTMMRTHHVRLSSPTLRTALCLACQRSCNEHTFTLPTTHEHAESTLACAAPQRPICLRGASRSAINTCASGKICAHLDATACADEPAKKTRPSPNCWPVRSRALRVRLTSHLLGCKQCATRK